MMSKAENRARKVCDAMVAEHAKRAEYFQSGEIHKYWLKDTVRVERHKKDVLSRHRQQSWYIPAVIRRKNGQGVYVTELGNNQTVEWDDAQLLLQEPDCHCHALIFEFTKEAFNSDNDREDDEPTASTSSQTSLTPAHQRDGYTWLDGRILLHRGTRSKFGAAL